MTRELRGWLLRLSVATGLDLLAVFALVFGRSTGPSWVAAAVLHLLAVAAVGLASRASRSQRALVAALTGTLPVLGAIVALIALATRRRGGVGEVPAREAPEPRDVSLTSIHRITDGLSVWESLMSGSAAERSATVAMLARRRDRISIALLRRAVAMGQSEVAAEAAMALEDVDTGTLTGLRRDTGVR
jgi:hypothetical protein